MGFLRNFDLFKQPFFLHINSKDRVTSSTGLAFSLMIYILLLLYFSKCDIFYKDSPKILDQADSQSNRPYILMKDQFFLVSVMDGNSINYIDPTIFSIDIVNYHSIANGSNGYSNVYIGRKSMHVCNQSDFPFDPTVLQRLSLNQSFCLDNNTLELEGYWDESSIKYARIMIGRCNNKTMNNTCQSLEAIEKFFFDKTINLYFTDNIIDLKNYKQPFKTRYRVDVRMIDISLYKIANLYFKDAEVFTDDGILFENLQSQKTFCYDSAETDIVMSGGSTTYFKYYLFSYPVRQVINRQYQKISDVFAILGGLMNFLFCICFFIAYTEKKLFLIIEIMNSLYKFEGTKIGNKINIFDYNTIAKKISNKIFGNFKNSPPKDNQILKNDKSSRFSLSFFEYITIFMKQLVNYNMTKKEKLFVKGETIYETEVDIVKILKKIKEIDKIKLILLNAKQLVLFNILTKPMIFLERKKSIKKISFENGYKMSQTLDLSVKKNEAQNVLEFYRNQDPHLLSEIDKKLFNLVDQEMVRFISNNPTNQYKK